MGPYLPKFTLTLTSREFGCRCRPARFSVFLASTLDFLQSTSEKIHFQGFVRDLLQLAQPLRGCAHCALQIFGLMM